jgi:acetylornithine/succinyldiaminopimelate/putrescine aminotransferase
MNRLTNRQLFFQHLAVPSELDDPPEFVSAEGIYLLDVSGKKYVDLVSGVSVSNVGHGNAKIIKAIQQQAENYMHLMVYGEFIQSPQVQYAKLLADNLPPSLSSVFFVNSGSEAIEGALKLAKRITGRTEIVSFKNAYHGSTHGALSVLGNEEMKYAFRPLLPEIHQLKFNEEEEIEKITEKTACVLIEPVQAEAGIIIPSKKYMQALRKRCDNVGAMLIFDEIQMGFGRTGKLFAFEHFDIVPDIICLAKAMGGGMPLGAFISSKENMNQLKHHPALGHITTFGGHPVCCASGMASLQFLIEEKLHESADSKGKLFVSRLKSHPFVKEIRQIGLMLAVELNEKEKAANLIHIFMKNGLIVDQFLFDHNSFRIAPPLTISEKEIDSVSDIIIQSLDELKKP